VAYQAEIQIGVKGADKLAEFQRTLQETNKVLEITNKTRDVFRMPLQNVQNYTKNLREAARALQLVEVGTEAETTAIRNYVQAKAEATTISNRHNRLMDEEAQKLGLVTQKLKEYNAAAAPARQVGSMTGAYLRPGEAGLRGQSSAINPEAQVAAAEQLSDAEADRLRIHQSLQQLEQRSLSLLEEKLNINRRITNEASLQAQRAKTREQQAGAGLSMRLPASQTDVTGVASEVQQLLALSQKLFAVDESRNLTLQKYNSLLTQGKTGLQAKVAVARQLAAEYEEFVGTLKKANDRQSQLFRASANRQQRGVLSAESERRQQALNNLARATNRTYEIQNKINQAGLAIRKNDFNTAKQLGREIDLLIKKEQRSVEIVKRRVAFRRQAVKAAKAEADAAAKERKRRVEGALSSGLIGGAFPLLFGQGIGAAAGGGIGGALGGAFGGQLGFALSLVGTQFGTFADQLVGGAATLGQALDPLTADLEALAEAAGYAGTETQAAIEVIRELGSEQQALEAATALLAVTVGNQGVVALQEFGENTADLGREFSRTMSLMQAAAAAMFSGIARMAANILERANDLSAGLKSDDPELVKLRQRREELLDTGRPSFGGSGAQTSARRTVNLSTEQRKELLAIEEKIRAVVRDKRLGIEQQTKAIAEQLQTTKFLNQFGIKSAALTATELKLASQKRDLTNSEYVTLLKLKAAQELGLRNKKAEEAIDKNKLEFLRTNGSLEKVRNKNLEDFKNKIAQIDRDSEAAIDRKNKKEASAANRANKQSEREIAAQRRILQASENAVEVQQNKLNLARAEGAAAKALLQFAVRKTQIEQKFAKQAEEAQKRGGPSAEETIRNIEIAEGLALTENQIRLDSEINKIAEDSLRPLNDKIQAYKDQVTFNETYRNLIKDGINPELARELTNIDLIYQKSLDQLNVQIQGLEVQRINNQLNDKQIAQLDKLIERRGLLKTLRSEAKTAATAADAAQPGKVQAYVDQLQQELDDTQGMIVSLAQTVESEIGSAMSSAITGVITGTQTVEEAMSTMFANIGKAFIDMATQMIAKALVMKALGILSGGLGGGGGEGFGVPVLTSGTNFFRANGGPVRPNGTYMVGEQGPELLTMGNQSGFVHSNTSEAMDRYRAGGSSGGGGSLNVNYNVTQINGMNFVTEEQFRAGMTQAAKDGAKMGEAGTFKTMRNSRSNRARVGL